MCLARNPIAVPELWTDRLVWPQACLVTCLETAGLDLTTSSTGLHSWITPCLASNVVMEFCFSFQVWGKHSFLGAWERSENENNIGSQKLFVIKTSLDHSTLSYSSLRDASVTSSLTGAKKFQIRILKITRGQGRGVIYFYGIEEGFEHYLKMGYMKLECSSGTGKAPIKTLLFINHSVCVSIKQNLISEN